MFASLCTFALLASLCMALGAQPLPQNAARVRNGNRPEWMEKDDVAMPVKWVRVDEVPQFEVRDGVCVIYMADRGERSWEPAERLLEGCWATGRTRLDAPNPGGVLLRWWRVTGAEVSRWYAERNGETDVLSGFMWNEGGACNVVTDRSKPAVGHELNHCFRGAFHPNTTRQPHWRIR